MNNSTVNETSNKNVWHLIIAMLTLPGAVVLVIPGILIWLYGVEPPAVGDVRFWLAKPMLPGGIFLTGWSITIFWFNGLGTPAPWSPPTRIIATGPYKLVRNPMLIGVLLLLVGQALLFNSTPIGIWAAVFFTMNTLYFIFVEEPALEKRFGDDYRLYKANVRRWLPRLRPWNPPWQNDEDADVEAPDADKDWQGYVPSEAKTEQEEDGKA